MIKVNVLFAILFLCLNIQAVGQYNRLPTLQYYITNDYVIVIHHPSTSPAVWGAVSRTLTAGTKDSEIAAIYGKLPTGSIADQATALAIKTQTDKMNFNAESPTKILAEATANAEISSEDIEAMADQVVAGVLDAEEISRLAEGTGSTQYMYTVRDENESPIPDVRVWVYSNSGLTTLIARSVTNNFGVCTFYLDPGTYYFVCQKAGYTFNNPDIETVSE